MKNIIVVLVGLLVTMAEGAPVKSILSARATSTTSASTKSTVKDYIQDGLVAMWDAEYNVGLDLPHDPSSRVWVDLSGNGHDVTNLSYYSDIGWVDSNARRIDRLAYGIPIPILDSEVKTVSVCCKSIKCSRSIPIIDFGNGSDNKRHISVYINKSCFICQKSRSYSPKIPDINNINSFTIVFDGDKQGSYTRNLGWFGDEPVQEYVSEWNNGNTRFQIGTYSGYGSGLIHSIRVYNRELSQDEITYNWNIDKERFGLE